MVFLVLAAIGYLIGGFSGAAWAIVIGAVWTLAVCIVCGYDD